MSSKENGCQVIGDAGVIPITIWKLSLVLFSHRLLVTRLRLQYETGWDSKVSKDMFLKLEILNICGSTLVRYHLMHVYWRRKLFFSYQVLKWKTRCSVLSYRALQFLSAKTSAFSTHTEFAEPYSTRFKTETLVITTCNCLVLLHCCRCRVYLGWNT